MSLSKELQELEERRSKLVAESLSLMVQQKKLEERTKALEQKIMEELTNNINKARQNISQLESMINDLEQCLRQITQKTKTDEHVDKTASQTANLEATEGVSAEKKGTVSEEHGESVAEKSVNDSSRTVEKGNSFFSLHQGTEKKRHRFLNV